MKNETTYIKIEQSLFLNGTIMVDGAKNSLLPIMVASMLTKGISKIHHAPPLLDMYSTIKLLEKYNVKVIYDEKEKILTIDTQEMAATIVNVEYFKKLRSSVLFSSVALLNFKEFWLGFPGGDKIGKRPINIHLEGLSAFGVDVINHNEYIYLKVKESLTPIQYYLPYPSVGATQNLLLMAAKIEGKSVLRNAAQEPEILDLIEVLEKMGAKIELFFGGTIIVHGNSNLKPFDHTIMSDRLEAATFLLAAAMTKGNINIPNAPAYAMDSIIYHLRKMGHNIEIDKTKYGLNFIANEKSIATNIKTMPYPGLATDYQAPLLALLSISEGESIIHETVFENRMLHAFELNKMGAQITVESDYAKIKGVNKLQGNVVFANDIRASATLILAGLVAEGETKVFGLHHLLRGYYSFEKKLQSIGASVEICNLEKNILNHIMVENKVKIEPATQTI
jgi:UDP-N-acetylglucosamine 1-carboxyvinyltransferase